ncbi:NlpC/P60 family protein [Fodinicola feengrottensis]
MRKNFVRLLVLTATLGAMAAPVAAVAAPTPITISSPSCPSVLKQGEKDGCVTDLQTRLNRYYALLGVDGDFGSDTLAAVKTYQSAQGLSVDGEVGPATKQSLLRTMATPPPGLATGGGASTIVQHATAIKNGAAEHGWRGGQITYAWGGGHGGSAKPSAGTCDGYTGFISPCPAEVTIGLDCSGFSRWVYDLAFGSDVLGGGTANDQMHQLHKVSAASAVPGDLVFFGTSSNAHHVGVFVGSGKMIDALQTGTLVRTDSLQSDLIGYFHYSG